MSTIHSRIWTPKQSQMLRRVRRLYRVRQPEQASVGKDGGGNADKGGQVERVERPIARARALIIAIGDSTTCEAVSNRGTCE